MIPMYLGVKLSLPIAGLRPRPYLDIILPGRISGASSPSSFPPEVMYNVDM